MIGVSGCQVILAASRARISRKRHEHRPVRGFGPSHWPNRDGVEELPQ